MRPRSEHRFVAVDAITEALVEDSVTYITPRRLADHALDAIPPAYHLAVACGPCPTCGGNGVRGECVGPTCRQAHPCRDCKGTGTLIGGALKDVFTTRGFEQSGAKGVSDRLRQRFAVPAPNRKQRTP
ncbi:MAG: hypothetical protein QOJ29_709 [Thermoleophilaceae bacterium]|nr:hypothetical protein [Thermoleophilaceae bacterium]